MQAKESKGSRQQTVPGEDLKSSAKPRRASVPPATTPLAEIEALSGDPNFMTSLARGLAVVRAFTEQRRRLTIAQISHKTAIPRAAVRRCLYTLAQLGYVDSEANTFSLRPKVLTLGHAYLSSTPLAILAQPFLDRVSDAVHESCSLAILDGDEVLYLARSATSRIMSVALNVGSRLPAYCTSMGRVLLAHLSERELDAYLAHARFHAFTERTVTAPKKLRQLLEAAHQAGYAAVDQELEIGLRSIAVPVSNSSGTVVAAINVSVQAARGTTRQMETRFLPHLQAAARDLGSLLRP